MLVLKKGKDFLPFVSESLCPKLSSLEGEDSQIRNKRQMCRNVCNESVFLVTCLSLRGSPLNRNQERSDMRLFVLLFLFGLSALHAQDKRSYVFPIKPGASNNSLSGSMGEIRTNHYHGGLDIRTEQRTGLPVHATDEGYIARLKVSLRGYGNVVYVRHPNGFTSVYGHLSRFTPELEAYLLEAQYRQEKHQIDLRIPAGRFPVKAGQVIAYSGNTGSSLGPHLHFELRDTADRRLNPLYYGFPEIRDNIKPTLEYLRFIPLSTGAHLNQSMNPLRVRPAYQNGEYVVRTPIRAAGTIGLSGFIYDKANGSGFKNGVSIVEVYVNQRLRYRHHVNKIDYYEMRTLNLFLDFPHYQQTGDRVTRFYLANENPMSMHDKNSGNGRLRIQAGKTYSVKIVLLDSYKNRRIVRLQIKGEALSTDVRFPDFGAAVFKQRENLLFFKDITLPSSSEALAHLQWFTQPLSPLVNRGGDLLFAWDLRRGIPDSITLPSGKRLKVPLLGRIPSGQHYRLQSPELRLIATDSTLFDTLYVRAGWEGELFRIGRQDIPLQRPLTFMLKPRRPLENPEKVAVFEVYERRSGRRSRYWQESYWKDGWIVCHTDALGLFEITEDTEPPSVGLIRRNRLRVQLRVRDNKTGLASYHATLNGKFLLMEYDRRSGLLTSKRLDEKPLRGDFRLVVRDKVGNETVYETRIP